MVTHTHIEQRASIVGASVPCLRVLPQIVVLSVVRALVNYSHHLVTSRSQIQLTKPKAAHGLQTHGKWVMGEKGISN